MACGYSSHSVSNEEITSRNPKMHLQPIEFGCATQSHRPTPHPIPPLNWLIKMINYPKFNGIRNENERNKTRHSEEYQPINPKKTKQSANRRGHRLRGSLMRDTGIFDALALVFAAIARFCGESGVFAVDRNDQ